MEQLKKKDLISFIETEGDRLWRGFDDSSPRKAATLSQVEARSLGLPAGGRGPSRWQRPSLLFLLLQQQRATQKTEQPALGLSLCYEIPAFLLDLKLSILHRKNKKSFTSGMSVKFQNICYLRQHLEYLTKYSQQLSQTCRTKKYIQPHFQWCLQKQPHLLRRAQRGSYSCGGLPQPSHTPSPQA